MGKKLCYSWLMVEEAAGSHRHQPLRIPRYEPQRRTWAERGLIICAAGTVAIALTFLVGWLWWASGRDVILGVVLASEAALVLVAFVMKMLSSMEEHTWQKELQGQDDEWLRESEWASFEDQFRAYVAEQEAANS